jgi:hypothetical protein
MMQIFTISILSSSITVIECMQTSKVQHARTRNNEPNTVKLVTSHNQELVSVPKGFQGFEWKLSLIHFIMIL